jgi:hypothetical protein
MGNTNEFYTFKIVHRALLIGQVLFLGVMFYLLYSKTVIPPLTAQDKIFQVIAILFAAIAFFAGNAVFKKRLAAIRDGAGISVKEKFEKYRSASIVRWALLEGAALFCGICFFLTGNYAFLGLALVVILLFAMQFPDKTKMALQSGLSIMDTDEL